jgi:hypothetical protein
MIFQVMKLSISETQLLGMNKCWLRGVARAGDRLFLQRVSAQRCAGGRGHATKFDPGKDPGEKEESLMSWFGWFHKLSIHPLVNFTLRWKKKKKSVMRMFLLSWPVIHSRYRHNCTFW